MLDVNENEKFYKIKQDNGSEQIRLETKIRKFNSNVECFDYVCKLVENSELVLFEKYKDTIRDYIVNGYDHGCLTKNGSTNYHVKLVDNNTIWWFEFHSSPRL